MRRAAWGWTGVLTGHGAGQASDTGHAHAHCQAYIRACTHTLCHTCTRRAHTGTHAC